MAMTETSFDRLQDILDNAGQLERRVTFSDVILTTHAQKLYDELF
jgi:hypothetical protein